MPIPDTLARKITADFRAEKKYGGRKKICDALANTLEWPVLPFGQVRSWESATFCT